MPSGRRLTEELNSSFGKKLSNVLKGFHFFGGKLMDMDKPFALKEDPVTNTFSVSSKDRSRCNSGETDWPCFGEVSLETFLCSTCYFRKRLTE